MDFHLFEEEGKSCHPAYFEHELVLNIFKSRETAIACMWVFWILHDTLDLKDLDIMDLDAHMDPDKLQPQFKIQI